MMLPEIADNDDEVAAAAASAADTQKNKEAGGIELVQDGMNKNTYICSRTTCGESLCILFLYIYISLNFFVYVFMYLCIYVFM